MVTPSVFIQLGSFNYRWRCTWLVNHWVSIWHCLALLLWLNMVTPLVFIHFTWFNLQMKNILLVYHFKIFTSIWHCLLIDHKDTSASFTSVELIQLVSWALYTVLTKIVYICFLYYQTTVFCSILDQFVLFNFK